MDDTASRTYPHSVANTNLNGWFSPSELDFFDDHHEYGNDARESEEHLCVNPAHSPIPTLDSTFLDTLTENNLHRNATCEPPPSSMPIPEDNLRPIPPGIASRSSRRCSTSRQATSSSAGSQTSQSVFVDLTEDSPVMAPPSRHAKNSKRHPEDFSQISSTSKKRRRVDSAGHNIEEVDLRDVNSDSDLARVLERQRAATVRAQQDEADKPTKLAGVTCVICMEEMTNITVTHCGHIFCHTCLMECLIAGENQDGKGQSKCPMCRKVVRRSKDKSLGQHVVPLEIKVASQKKAK